MNRRALQACLVILGLVPIITGVLGLMGVDDPLYASLGLPRDTLLDSNMRFYSGVWFALGLTVLWTVRSLEKHVALYRVLWAMIFVGGLGRLFSIVITRTWNSWTPCLRSQANRWARCGACSARAGETWP